MKPKVLPKILIVDDQPEVRKLVRMTLELGDYALAEAASGAEALQEIAADPPQLVLLDVMMPGALDGYEVCKRIKANPELNGLRVLLLTAKGQSGDLEAGCASGADAYLVKPFSPLELVELVERLLAR